MSGLHYFISLSMFFGTILIVFGLLYLGTVQKAKAGAAHGEAYRLTAERAAAAVATSAEALVSIQSDLADVRTRLAAIETILKEVG